MQRESVLQKRLIEKLADTKWLFPFRPLKMLASQAALLFFYKYRIPYRKLISAWLHGFYGDKNILYDFSNFPHRSYLSDFARHVRTPKINSRKYVLSDKIVFTYLLTGLGARTPRIYAEYYKGKLVLPNDDSPAVDLESLIRQHRQVVIKPRSGSGGWGVHFVTWRGEMFVVNGKIVQALPNFGDNYIISEFVTQHEYAARIYPNTTNTVRMLTMWDYKRSLPFIGFAIHRFGTARSFPVDNWGRGGLSAYIDVETGILGRAAAKPTSNSLEWYETHPETRQRISGVKIPGWEALKAQVLLLAKKLVSIPYIGWDLVVTDGSFAIIEGNNRSDVNLLQIHRPLLLDERVAHFYRKHGVIH